MKTVSTLLTTVFPTVGGYSNSQTLALALSKINNEGFQNIQDPLNFSSVIHHTNLDVCKYVPERDMIINTTVIAALVHQIAQIDTRLPRKE